MRTSHAPHILPVNWESIPVPDVLLECGLPCAAFSRIDGGLRVLMSEETHAEDTHWLHISVSCPRRNPTWEELKFCKKLFLGDVVAVQILPKEKDYINVMPFCFHLYHRLDGDTVPGRPESQGAA